jgi:hypothetical protein
LIDKVPNKSKVPSQKFPRKLSFIWRRKHSAGSLASRKIVGLQQFIEKIEKSNKFHRKIEDSNNFHRQINPLSSIFPVLKPHIQLSTIFRSSFDHIWSIFDHFSSLSTIFHRLIATMFATPTFPFGNQLGFVSAANFSLRESNWSNFQAGSSYVVVNPSHLNFPPVSLFSLIL